MPGKTKPTKDLSGHVALNAEEAHFYSRMEAKRLSIERARFNGTLKFPPTRNPLLSEKTPREMKVKYGKEWNFDPGKAPTPRERWIYPEHNDTIMSKFRSQRKIFATQAGWENTFKDQVNSFNDNETKLAAEAKAAAEAVIAEEEALLSTRADVMNSARSNISALTDRSTCISMREPPEKHMNTTAMKHLARENPELLARIRAEKAAKYVSGLAKPIYPPTYRDMNARDIFKPAGTVKMKDVNMEKKEKKKVRRQVSSREEECFDTARLKSNLGHLMEQLEATNNQLAKQELKVALNTKTKGYEKPRNSSGANSARSGRHTARSTGR
jgi:hypothetical protein